MFVDFTWGAGGSTSDLTMELTVAAKNTHGVTPNMHLTCTNMPSEKIDKALAKAREEGIRNILALRGDPPGPLGSTEWVATEGGFECALDLIKYIRQQHGDYFCISVSGYPEGHPDKITVVPEGLDGLTESERTRYSTFVDDNGNEVVQVCRDEAFEAELDYLKAKVDAGASIIVTQMFFDPEVYGHFITACRAKGINVPILPGIMCLAAYGGFQRMTKFCKTRVPPSLLAAVEAAKDDEEAFKQVGIDHGTYMCRRVLELGCPGLHFYTLNLETVCVGILKELGRAGTYIGATNDKDAKIMAAGTTTAGGNATPAQPYKIADISLAPFGKQAIDFARTDMRGLVACKESVLALQEALRGLRIAASLSINALNAPLVEALHQCGAHIRLAPAGPDTTEDHVAAALADANRAAVFAWKGQTLAEYWECLLNTLKWPDNGPDALIDEVGDLSLLIHTGYAAEERFASTNALFESGVAVHEELAIIHEIITRQHQADPQFWHNLVARVGGCTTVQSERIRQLASNNELKYPAIRLDTSVVITKISNVYGARHSLIDWVMRATDVMLAGKRAVVCGFGDVGKGVAKALKSAGAIVYVAEIDPICALQAAVEGFSVVTLDHAVEYADLIITTTNNVAVVNEAHFSKLKNNCIVCNISAGAEIDMAALKRAATVQNIKAGVDRYVFPDGRGVIVLGDGRVSLTHPSLVTSMNLTIHALALTEIAVKRQALGVRVHDIKKEFDEQTATLHCAALGLEITVLTAEQAEYIGVPLTGPFKPEHYRY